MRKITKKGWIRKNEELLRQLIKKRSDYKCELCGSPERVQVDHCFSRKTHELFYHLPNLTLLCRSCHFLKSPPQNNQKKILEVYDRVRAREGIVEFKNMWDTAKKIGGFPEWQLIFYHQDVNFILTRELAAFNK